MATRKKTISNLFKIEIPCAPEVGDYISVLKLDLYQKLMTLEVLEDETMKVFDWIGAIRERYDLARKEMHLADQDMIYLTILNNKKKVVAIYRFAKLILNYHEIEFKKDSKENKLLHKIVINFERYEKDKN